VSATKTVTNTSKEKFPKRDIPSGIVPVRDVDWLLPTHSDSSIIPQKSLSSFKFNANFSLPSQMAHCSAASQQGTERLK